jgi:dermatan 4-sulfotransferase 1
MDEFLEFFGDQVLNETVCISIKNKYIYFEVPKSGSGSILKALHAVELGNHPGVAELEDHPAPINSPFVKPYQLGTQEFVHLLKDPNFFKFSFVRNPYTRILSAYLDKVLSRDEAVAEYYRIELGITPDKNTPDFHEFIEIVSNQNPRQMNKHWRPQVYQSFARFCELDFVGKIETFETDFMYVGQRLGLFFHSPPHYAPHATGAQFQLEKFYNTDAQRKILHLYFDDFESFQYDHSLPIV